MDKEYKSDAGVFAIGMTKKEIRVLVYWACIGIARAKGGSYESVAPQMVRYFAKELKIKLPYRPEFNSKTRSYKRKPRITS